MISLRAVDGRTSRRPGEVFELEAAWDLQTVPERFEISFFWGTTGYGGPDLQEISMTDARTDKLRGTRRFEFAVPGGPLSFKGSLITIGWAVEMVVDEETARYEFNVGQSDLPLAATAPAITISR